MNANTKQAPDLRTVSANVFNAKVSEVVTSLNGADKSLVSLVAAAGFRWFDEKADRGGNDVIRNLINRFEPFPTKQKKLIAILKTFAPLEIKLEEGKEDIYTVETIKKLKDLTEEEKQAYITVIESFVALDLKRITDYGKKEKEPKEPKQLNTLEIAAQCIKSVSKALNKYLENSTADRNSVINALILALEDLKEKPKQEEEEQKAA